MPTKTFRTRDFFFISAYAFALSYLWASLGPLVLPQLVERVAPANLLGTAFGGLRFVGLLVAIIVQPVAGALSDQARTRFGKRKPFILIGTIGDFVFLAALLLAGDYLWLIVAYFGLQFASNIAHGAYQGFIPDLVPEAKRGSASGAKSLAEMVANIVASIFIAGLFGSGQWTLGFITIGVVLALSVSLTWFGVREGKGNDTPLPQSGGGWVGANWRELFSFDRRRDESYRWWLVSRFFMLTGVYVLQTYAFLFVKNVIQPPEPNAVVGPLLAIIGLLIALSAQPAGIIADHVGHKRMVFVAGALNALSVFLMIFATGRILFTVAGYDVRDILLFAVPVGIGMGIFLVTNWALGIQLAPSRAGGKYLGISNLATAGAGLAASLLGPIIDLIGYIPLFIIGTLSILIGMGLLTKIRQPAVSAVPTPIVDELPLVEAEL